MTDHLLLALQANYLRRCVFLGIVVTVSLICNISCAVPVSDPAFETVRQALQNDDKDPDTAYVAIQSNLNSVKDQQIIPLLLDYLNMDRHRQTGYPGILGEVVFYLERISGVRSHVSFLIGDPYYMNRQDEDKDIRQWQAWWDANKDYNYWDEKVQSLKVKPY